MRSFDGWSVVKAMRKGAERIKGDEPTLGDGNFVEAVLKETQEDIERKSRFQAGGYNFEWLVNRVAQLLGLESEDVLAHGKYPQNVRARSLLCFWGTRELGMTTVELACKLNLSQPPISQVAGRGKRIAQDQGLCLMEKGSQ